MPIKHFSWYKSVKSNFGDIYMSNYKIHAVFSILLTFLLTTCVYAKEPTFPKWMDEVNFNTNNNNKINFNEPSSPIDPETGKPSPIKSNENRFFRKPRLPDFKKLRQKALKAKMEKNSSGTTQINPRINLSIKNLSNLKKSEQSLDEQLRRAASDILKRTLISQKNKLSNKIKALEEIKSILARQNAKSISEIKSPRIMNRINQLSSFIFNIMKPHKKTLEVPKPITIETNQGFSHSIPKRFYRPKPFKSFYLESKEKEKENNE